MATIQGIGGVAVATGFGIKASGWTANIVIGTTDTSGFDDAGYLVREATTVSMDGTISGTADDGTSPVPSAVFTATPDPDAAKVTTTLTSDTGKAYSCTAVVNNIAHNRPFDAKHDITLSFLSSGAITQTW